MYLFFFSFSVGIDTISTLLWRIIGVAKNNRGLNAILSMTAWKKTATEQELVLNPNQPIQTKAKWPSYAGAIL